MKYIPTKWMELTWIGRAAYIAAGLLFILMVVEGLVLESLGMSIPGAVALVDGLYVATIVLALFAKQWKLAVIVFVGFWLLWAFLMGVSEVLWYYLKTWFGIDISYR